MNKANRVSLIVLPFVLAIGAGIALAGSQGGAKFHGVPVFALVVAMAFAIQWVAFVPAFLLQSERFYDLTGSLTYIAATIAAVALSPTPDARVWVLLAVVLVWAVRLGTYLFRRILRAGADKRFDEIKPLFFRFLLTWTLQGLWVSVTAAAALAAITATARESFGVVSAIGLTMWVAGIAVEATADLQKSRFRADPRNAGRFISTGLWSWSRHPNYFGEIVLWIGVALIAVPVLSGWQYVTLVSPVFVFLLLTRVSGVPLLEKSADDRWGGQSDYETYKARTPVLVPRPPSRRNP